MTSKRKSDTESAIPWKDAKLNDGKEGSHTTFSLKKVFNKQEVGCVWEKPFPVNGQGTLVFNVKSKSPLFVSVEDQNGDNSMALCITKEKAWLLQYTGDKVEVLATSKNGTGLETTKFSYWYSYNRDNLVLKYGKGYRMEETTLLKYDFLKGVTDPNKQKEIRAKMYPYFNAEGKKYVRQYEILTKSMTISAGGIQVTEKMVEFDKNPFICNIPPLVLDSSKLNLFYLDQGEFIFSASLPPACKELYQNVSNCELNYPEEVDSVLLSDAIRYSIETDGCTLNQKLKDKAGEFGDDPHETYLRVTLGHSLGKSPGIPYVLEIWPKQHYSPVHNHGNSNAVIKVLHGTIRINIYNKDTTDPNAKPLNVFDAKKGDVTWINRNWYQTHKLHNVSNDYCATIQCYNYDSGDMTHWPYFDYIEDNHTIGEFIPDSDFTFQEMRTKVICEYKAAKN